MANTKVALRNVLDLSGYLPALEPTTYALPDYLSWVASVYGLGARWSPALGGWELYETDTGRPFDVSSLKLTGGTAYYVGWPGASSGNSGLSPSASKNSISNAITAASAGDTIYVYGKSLSRSLGFNNTNVTKSLNIIGIGGKARLGVHEDLTWSLASGATATYQATRSAVASVWDAKGAGPDDDYSQLALAGSYAGSGDLNPGEYYVSGSTVYARTADSRVLTGDTDIRVFLAQANGQFGGSASGVVIYLENLSFEGGSAAVTAAVGGASNSLAVYAKNCDFKYAWGSTAGDGNGFAGQGCYAVLQGCRATRNLRDGFNWHFGSTLLARFIETGCVGEFNGFVSGGSSNNGSTSHDGCPGLRVGGEYLDSQGPNVIDVNTGTKTLNLGVHSHHSRVTGGVSGANFYCDTGEMTLVDCKSDGSDYDAVAASGGTVTARNLYAPRQSFSASASTVTHEVSGIGPAPPAARRLSVAEPREYHGYGTPEGTVIAAPGSTYRNKAGGAGASYYVKEDDAGTSTGWVAK